MEYDIIVIGSGIGGLSAASLLAKEGKKVLVLEQADLYGGYGQSMEKNGYVFDYAIHSIADWNFVKTLLDEIDESVPHGIVSARRGDHIVFPEHDVWATNIDNIIEELSAQFPEEKESIEKYFNDLIGSMNLLLKYTKNPNVQTAAQLVIKYPDLWSNSLEDVLNFYFKSDKVKALIYAFHDGYCYDYTWNYAGYHLYYIKYLHEAHAVKNGSRHMVDAFVRAIKKYGSELWNRTMVKRIILEKGEARGVILEDGRKIMARDAVISNADARLTYSKMLDKETLPADLAEAYNKWDKSGPSLSYYIVNCGLRVDVKEKYGMKYDLTIYYPSYDVPRVLKDINSGILPDGFWLWAVFPSVNDDSVAPKGHSTAIFSILVPYDIENETDCDPEYFDGFRAVKDKGEKYYLKKKEITKRIIQRAEEVFPGISKYIVFQETWTPQTLQDFTLNHKGSAMGFKVEPVGLKDKKYLSKNGLNINSGITGLYQVGGWSQFGFATVACLQSARFAVLDILGKERPAHGISDTDARVTHLNKEKKEY